MRGRAMLVKRLQPVLIEAVVRGHLAQPRQGPRKSNQDRVAYCYSRDALCPPSM